MPSARWFLLAVFVSSALAVTVSTAKNSSSVFVNLPQGWDSPKESSEFTCPENWYRDADFEGKVHCACSPPCKDFISDGKIGVSTRAPNASGEYAWKILAYDSSGKVVYEESPIVKVENPPDLQMTINGALAMVENDKIVLNAVLENKGEATAGAVNFSLKVHTPEGYDVTDKFKFTLPGQASIEGSHKFSFDLVLSTDSAPIGEKIIAIGGVGEDENSKKTVRGSGTHNITVSKPALLGVLSVSSPAIISKGQLFELGVLMRNDGGVPAERANVTVYAKKGETIRYVGSAVAGTVEPSGLQKAFMNVSIAESGSYVLEPKVSFIEAYSEKIKDAATAAGILANPGILVQEPAKLEVSLLPEKSEVYTNEELRVKLKIANAGEANSMGTKVVFGKATGGCELVGAKENIAGVLAAKREAEQEWVFATGNEGGTCKLFFQASGSDANSGETVFSRVVVEDVTVNAREKASFNDIGVDFFQKGGEWYALKPLKEKDWDFALGPNSKLSVLVEKIAEKQDAIEARLRSLEITLEAKAAEMQGGSVKSEVTVQLLKPPSKDASVDLKILPPTEQNALKLTEISGVVLKKPLALVKVDKTDLKNNVDIDSANVKVEVEKKEVDSTGGPDNVIMVREDQGEYSILPTRLLSQTAKTYVFEAFSENGLSLFALYSVEQIVPEEKVSPATGNITASQFFDKGYLAILVVVILMAVFAVIRMTKRKSGGNSGILDLETRPRQPQPPDLPPWEKHRIDKSKNLPEDV
ncbi:hypothetical protein HZC09_00675 [Candidatus Micrarchaeota archaeon]|nr:hypothetical protein [Candidatus Micrarchaeota archaeon]